MYVMCNPANNLLSVNNRMCGALVLSYGKFSNAVPVSSFLSFLLLSLSLLSFSLTSCYQLVPYGVMSNDEVKKMVLEGGRLSRPSRCSQDLFIFVTTCWAPDPNDRPSFEQIFAGWCFLLLIMFVVVVSGVVVAVVIVGCHSLFW